MLEMYLGGARSGKSRLAELRANQIADGALTDTQLIYVATATAGDDEMATRITHHQQSRGSHWRTVEEPFLLAETLQQISTKNTCVLVDCLTLWLTNLLLADDKQLIQLEKDKLLSVLSTLSGHIIFVSNEVGQGLVATDPLSRRFVDEAGFLHQKLAQACNQVHYVVAGIAQTLK